MCLPRLPRTRLRLASDLTVCLALPCTYFLCLLVYPGTCSFFVSQEERYNRQVVLADGRTVSYSVAGNPDGLPVFLFLVSTAANRDHRGCGSLHIKFCVFWKFWFCLHHLYEYYTKYMFLFLFF